MEHEASVSLPCPSVCKARAVVAQGVAKQEAAALIRTPAAAVRAHSRPGRAPSAQGQQRGQQARVTTADFDLAVVEKEHESLGTTDTYIVQNLIILYSTRVYTEYICNLVQSL